MNQFSFFDEQMKIDEIGKNNDKSMNETSVSSIMSISTDAGSIYNRYQSNQVYRFFR